MATKAEIIITAKNKTKAAFRGVQGGLKKIRSAVNSTKLAMVALAGVAGLGLLINKSLKTVDALGKLSDRLNISVVDLQTLQLQAELSGSSTEAISKSLEKMTRNLGDMARGTGEAKLAMEAMNLDIESLLKMDAGEQYRDIAEAISGLSTQAEKASAAAAIFGRAGVQMINMLEGGSAAFDAAKADIVDMGAALDRLDVAKVEAANDAITRAQVAFGGFFQNLTVELAPFIEVIANIFVDLAKDNNGFRDAIIDNVESIVMAVAKMANVWRGLKAVWIGLKLALSVVAEGWFLIFVELDTAITDIMNKIPGVSAAYSETLRSMAASQTETSRKLREELEDILLAPLPSQNLKTFFDALRAGAEENAKKIADAMAGRTPALDAPETGAEQLAKDKIQRQLERLQLSFFTEEQRLQESLNRRQDIVEASFENGLIGEQARMDLMLQLETDFEAKLSAITLRESQKRLKLEQYVQNKIAGMRQNVFSLSVGLLQTLGQDSKKFAYISIALEKGLSIALAIQNTAVAVTKALTVDPTGSLAARVAMLGKIQIGLIAATGLAQAGNVGAGVGGGSALGGASAPTAPTALPDTVQVAPTTEVNLTVSGIFDAASVRDLIEKINDEIGDGVQLNVTVAA